jgi:hypothetical protein
MAVHQSCGMSRIPQTLALYAFPEIKDSDLAKRNKIHNMIVSESVEYLEALTKQLKVCQCFNP